MFTVVNMGIPIHVCLLFQKWFKSVQNKWPKGCVALDRKPTWFVPAYYCFGIVGVVPVVVPTYQQSLDIMDAGKGGTTKFVAPCR